MALTAPSEPPLHGLSVSALADHCMNEINKYRCGEPYNEQYCVELFRRAMMQRDPLAWEVVQQRFHETMLRWMRAHPQRELACRLDNEENYLAQAFARFWLATANNPALEFKTLAAALRYLRASLNGAILDTLRAYLRPEEIPLPEPGESAEPFGEDSYQGGEVWEVLQSLLPDKREQRVAYLLFHCGLKPRDIIRYRPEEFSDVHEVYRLRRNIKERLLRHADYLRWRL